MSQLRRNVAANFVGRACIMAATLAFVPLYMRMMGLAASGLIGFSVTLNAAVQLMDMGLSTTLNRDMARFSAVEGQARQSRNLLRTLEIVYWPLSLLIAGTITAIAPWISHHWFQSDQFTPSVIQSAVVMMGLSIALQWPFSLYEGGLLGLQQQILVNIIGTASALLRTVGSLAILLLFGKTVQVYFGWQIIISAAMTVAVYVALWQRMPRSDFKPVFDRQALKSICRFASGVMGSSIAAFLVSQSDRIILSKQVSLAVLGCYTTAAQFAGILLCGVGPFFTALFPRFVQLFTLNEPERLSELYHRSCQIVSVIILPSAATLALFAPDLVRVLESWTARPLHLAHTDRLLMLLALGTAANALMNIPYALQLASGWTKLAFYQNICTLCLQIPLTIWLAARLGAVGVASVWLLVNGSYLLIMIPIMHRRLLPGEMMRWYCQDVGLPLMAAVSITGLARLWQPGQEAPLLTLFRVGIIWIIASMASLLTAPITRQMAHRQIKRAALPQVRYNG